MPGTGMCPASMLHMPPLVWRPCEAAGNHWKLVIVCRIGWHQRSPYLNTWGRYRLFGRYVLDDQPHERGSEERKHLKLIGNQTSVTWKMSEMVFSAVSDGFITTKAFGIIFPVDLIHGQPTFSLPNTVKPQVMTRWNSDSGSQPAISQMPSCSERAPPFEYCFLNERC